MFILQEENEQVEPINTLLLKQEAVKRKNQQARGHSTLFLSSQSKRLDWGTSIQAEFYYKKKRIGENMKINVNGLGTIEASGKVLVNLSCAFYVSSDNLLRCNLFKLSFEHKYYADQITGFLDEQGYFNSENLHRYPERFKWEGDINGHSMD